MNPEPAQRAKAYTKCQLAALYKINPATFTRWLVPFIDRVGHPHNGSRIYTPAQVAIIFECLGDP